MSTPRAVPGGRYFFPPSARAAWRSRSGGNGDTGTMRAIRAWRPASSFGRRAPWPAGRGRTPRRSADRETSRSAGGVGEAPGCCACTFRTAASPGKPRCMIDAPTIDPTNSTGPDPQVDPWRSQTPHIRESSRECSPAWSPKPPALRVSGRKNTTWSITNVRCRRRPRRWVPTGEGTDAPPGAGWPGLPAFAELSRNSTSGIHTCSVYRFDGTGHSTVPMACGAVTLATLAQSRPALHQGNNSICQPHQPLHSACSPGADVPCIPGGIGCGFGLRDRLQNWQTGFMGSGQSCGRAPKRKCQPEAGALAGFKCPTPQPTLAMGILDADRQTQPGAAGPMVPARDPSARNRLNTSFSSPGRSPTPVVTHGDGDRVRRRPSGSAPVCVRGRWHWQSGLRQDPHRTRIDLRDHLLGGQIHQQLIPGLRPGGPHCRARC